VEVYGADINGIRGNLISFRTVKEDNKRGVTVLGLASKVVKEGIVRAMKAIETLNGDWDVVNNQGYTFDLSPAEVAKTSSGLDLPIAIMLLQACIAQNLDKLDVQIKKLRDAAENPKKKEQTKQQILEKLDKLLNLKKNIQKYRNRLNKNKNKYLLIGKLDIFNGRLETPYYGMLSLISAAKKGFTIIVPEDAEIHASLVARANPKVLAFIAQDIQEVWDIILDINTPRVAQYSHKRIKEKRILEYIPDLKAIHGVTKAKLAMRVALAGGHNILLVGPPGQGKTMLAEAATELLPTLDQGEMFEINKIYSAKGYLKANEVVLRRPYQAANNNFTLAALMGGGHPYPVPGLVSLAHKGVLYLDEINLCKGNIIENLRTAMSGSSVNVQRVHSTISYPCNFVLVAAMNPCRCGWYRHYECQTCGHISMLEDFICPKDTIRLEKKCHCSISSIESYKNQLSKPILDRIDLKVLVSSYDENFKSAFNYASSTVKREINAARELQRKRYRNVNFISCNADVPDRSEFEKHEDIDRDLNYFLKQSYKRFNIATKRMEVKVMLIARTIADLESYRKITPHHIEHAVDLMGLNDPYFKDFS
jgi:magnesium chelatase family protein